MTHADAMTDAHHDGYWAHGGGRHSPLGRRLSAIFQRAGAVVVALGLGSAFVVGEVNAQPAEESESPPAEALSGRVDLATLDFDVATEPQLQAALHEIAIAGSASLHRAALEALVESARRDVRLREQAVLLISPWEGGISTEKTLIELLAAQSNSRVAVALTRALGRVGAADSVPVLIDRAALADPSRWAEREAALLALGTLATRFGPYLPEPGPAVLAEAAAAADPFVKSAALWALSEVPSQAAEAALRAMAQVPGGAHAEAAARALSRLQWSRSDWAVALLHQPEASLPHRAALARGLARQTQHASLASTIDWIRGCLVRGGARGVNAQDSCEPALVAAALQVWLAERTLPDWMFMALHQLDGALAALPTVDADQGRLRCLLAAVVDVRHGSRTVSCGGEALAEHQRALYRLEALRRTSPVPRAELLFFARHRHGAVRRGAWASLAAAEGLDSAALELVLADEDSGVASVGSRYLQQQPASAALHARSLRAAASRAFAANDAEAARAALAALRAAGLNADGVTAPADLAPAATAPEPSNWTEAPPNVPFGATLVTDRGQVEIRFKWASAPAAVAGWVGRAAAGHYDGSEFSDVISGQAAFGAPVSPAAGSLDLAAVTQGDERVRAGALLADRDPSGAVRTSFVIAQSDQPQLEGALPLIAEVVRGMDVVHRLIPGDRIRRVRLVRPLPAQTSDHAERSGAANGPVPYRQLLGAPSLRPPSGM